MITSELIRFVREEIKKQINIVLSGQAGDNSTIENEDIQNLYPGFPTIQQRPVMHPFGYASRAPSGTISVTCRSGASPENKMVLGHRDDNRADLGLNPGDSVMYSTDALGSAVVVQAVAGADGSFTIKTPTGNFNLAKDGAIGISNAGGSIMVSNTGAILAKSKGGAELNLDATGKVALGNATGETLDYLSQLANLVATATAAGFGAPLSVAAQALTIFNKIALLKGSL